MSYLGQQYSEARQPRTSFPAELAAELWKRGFWGPTTRTLDVGSGRGDFTKALCAEGLDREGPAKHKCSAEGWWPMARETYDLVFSKSTIEHLREPVRMLHEAKRVLKRGGRIVVMTPDWRTYQLTFWDDYTHYRPYDAESMRDMLEVAGFHDVRTELFYQYPAAWRSRSLSALFTLWRWTIPLRFSLWLCDKTGLKWPKWASQLTVLATGTKP